MDKPVSRGIGVVSTSSNNEHTFELVENLELEEFQSIADAAGNIERVNSSTQISLIDKNYRRVMSMRKLYSERFRQGQRNTALTGGDAVGNLSNEVTNWLTATRLFVDHLASQFSRLYGEDSVELRELKGKYSAEFDGNPAYSFLYKLRNYTQHLGFPVSSVSFGAADDGDPTSDTITRFTLDREKLAAEFDWGAVVGPILRGMPEEIEVLDLIEQAMPSFQRIYIHVFHVRVAHARGSIDIVRNAASRVSQSEGVPHLLDFGQQADHGGFEKLQFIRLPIELATALESDEKVSETAERFAAWSNTESVPTAISMNSAERERLAVAVALMGVYLEDSGARVQFDSAINNCIALAGSPNPLIGGMVEMSAISLFMASAAIGTTPEDLLGNMLIH